VSYVTDLYTPDVAETPEHLKVLVDLDALQLRKPYAVLGFGGWIDAGFAATGAVRHLVDQLQARPIAELDPEHFYSFTDTRPRVKVQGQVREAQWPRAEWFVVQMPEGVDHDLVLFMAPEPNLRWRTFTDVMLDLLERLGVEMFVSLGAVLAPVHHRAKVSLRGRGTTEQLRAELKRRRIGTGNYQGPTGISTVLMIAAQERGLPSLSLSASSPNYLANVPNPHTSAALLRATADLLGVKLPLAELEKEARGLLDQIDQSIAEQPELREAVERLADEIEPSEAAEPPAAEPESPPSELPSSAAVLQDLEDFLRDLRQQNGDAGPTSQT
jgi:proteasome assembly chaperone (PAC2) family protein